MVEYLACLVGSSDLHDAACQFGCASFGLWQDTWCKSCRAKGLSSLNNLYLDSYTIYAWVHISHETYKRHTSTVTCLESKFKILPVKNDHSRQKQITLVKYYFIIPVMILHTGHEYTGTTSLVWICFTLYGWRYQVNFLCCWNALSSDNQYYKSYQRKDYLHMDERYSL